MKSILYLFFIISGLLPLTHVMAHHILGRPAYSLNEDSNTPPSMQVETRIGSYFINYMVFPAFPRPGEPGKINLYATHLDTAKPFSGEVTFKVRDDSWFSKNEEFLGVQPVDDNVYRQGFVFSDAGSYIVTAIFEAEGEPYVIDFPLRIGQPPPIGPIGVTIGIIMVVLIGVSLIQRKRLQNAKIRNAHEETHL
jgi:hypothetical protein